MSNDYAWTAQATFPAEENAIWWADQVTGDYPELEVHRAGEVVTVLEIPDRDLRDGLTMQAYTRYNAEDVTSRVAAPVR